MKVAVYKLNEIYLMIDLSSPCVTMRPCLHFCGSVIYYRCIRKGGVLY